MRAKSPGDGKGSSFIVTLPVIVVHPDAPGPADERSRSKDAADKLCRDQMLEGVRALVLDDEPDARRLIRRVLIDGRAEVALASSAREALELIEEFRRDVIVSDVGMPEQDGCDFILQVRANHSSRQPPAAGLTAFARAEDRRQARFAGFLTHLAKPVDPEESVAFAGSLAGGTETA